MKLQTLILLHAAFDAQFPAQLRERGLRSLYCSSVGVLGRGAVG